MGVQPADAGLTALIDSTMLAGLHQAQVPCEGRRPLAGLRHAWRAAVGVTGSRAPRSAACRRCWLGGEREVGVMCRASGAAPTKRKPGRKQAEKVPPVPTPAEYQQTLRKSFTLGGIGLHTGEYAYVRVKPACPGEGRYFVRVPLGTNSSLFQPLRPTRVALEEVGAFPSDDLSEDVRTGLFFEYLRAQDERGYDGTFAEYVEDLKAADESAEAEAAQAQQEEEPAVPRAEADGEFLPASIECVEQQHAWCTVLGGGDNSVLGAEHLLAALEACGVDNARIEIEGGPEVPIVDGSALGWAIEVQKAGLRPAGPPSGAGQAVARGEAEAAARTAPAPLQRLMVQEGESFVAFFPGPSTQLSVGVDHAAVAPVIGRQWFSWSPGRDDHFRWEVAPARTFFASADEVLEMVQRGELRGGPDFCALIADGEDWEDDNVLRFAGDEPARHAMIDLLGALSLAAQPGHRGLPVGHIVAFNASHDLQLRFVRELVQTCSLGQEFCDHPVVSS